MTTLARPPKDLDSFLGRKWLESIISELTAAGDIADGTFLLITADPVYPNARTIAVNATLSSTDAGVGSTLTLSINLNNANTWLQDQSVPDEAYNALWNGSVEVPTKNALYDKIETIITGAAPSQSLLRPFFFGGA